MAEDTDPNRPEQKPPVCGVLSLAAPLLGLPLVFGLAKGQQGVGWGWGAFFILVIGGLIALVVGVVAALIGLGRSEKFSALSVIGLVLNGGILLWVFSVGSR